MSSTEKELEDQLMEAGYNLLKPPSSVDELLSLLDLAETLLLRVEQSPSKSMQNAISPLMKALVANDLLRHSDMDVKVAIASCISEVTRITAPEAPYNDDQMKEIFQLIVAAFEKLFETSDHSYSKRVSILETVAKVRSCVLMLDLECDSLILKMFQHFLSTIRDFHPESVFTSMETIMSLVLEESEDISSEILAPLLRSVKKENRDVLPITRQLAEKVLENCGPILKPYLKKTVVSMGLLLNDYSKVVSSICQETSEEHKVNASEEHKANESTLKEKTASDEPQVTKEMEIEEVGMGEVDPLVKESPKLVTSNGISKTEDEESLVALTSPEKKPDRSHTTSSSKGEFDGLESKTTKTKTLPDRSTKKKKKRERQKHISSIDASTQPFKDSDKEDTAVLVGGTDHSKETSNSLPEGSSIAEPAGILGHGKETVANLSSPTASHDEAKKVASPFRNQNVPDETRSKRIKGRSNKKEKKILDTNLGSPFEPKGDQVEEEAPVSADNILKNEYEGNSDSEARPYKRSCKKAVSEKVNEDKQTPKMDVISKDSDLISDSEVKPLKQSLKKLNTSDTEDEVSVKKLGGEPKKGRGKTISDKRVGEPGSKSAKKSINKDLLEETPKTTLKRKYTPTKEEASKISSSVEELDEKLVGSRIRVWWPIDHTFYEGVVDSFDPVKKRHKVLYVDGDIEVLRLSKQRWEYVKRNRELDEGQSTDLQTEEHIEEKPEKKKAKTKSDSSTQPAKTDALLKGVKGTSTSKSNVEALESEDKLKDDDKLIRNFKDIHKTPHKSKERSTGKSMEDTSKTGSNSKKGTPKLGSMPKDDTPKASTKSKEESSGKSDENITKKSKEGTPKTNMKSKNESASKSDENTISKRKDISKTARKHKESTGKSEENTSKSKDSTPKLGRKSKDDTPKTSAKSKDESASKSKETTAKTKTDCKSKDGTLKLGSKSKDENAGDIEEDTTLSELGGKSKGGDRTMLVIDTKGEGAGKPKENNTKSGSKSKKGKTKLSSKTEGDDTPKTSTKYKTETPKTNRKPANTNGISIKGKSGSLKVQESEDMGKEKLVDDLGNASQQESEAISLKKRRRK